MPYKPVFSLSQLEAAGLDVGIEVDSVVSAVETNEMIQRMITALNQLSPETRRAIQMHFGLQGDEKSFGAIGNSMNKSREWARQKVLDGLGELRSLID